MKAETITLITNKEMIAKKILMADDPRIQRNATKMIRASSKISRTSANEICKNPKIPNTINITILKFRNMRNLNYHISAKVIICSKSIKK